MAANWSLDGIKPGFTQSYDALCYVHTRSDILPKTRRLRTTLDLCTAQRTLVPTRTYYTPNQKAFRPTVGPLADQNPD